MPDLATMLAAYAATYPDETDRLILADWLEERGDVRGAWLRDPLLAQCMGPSLADPVPQLIALLGREARAGALLAQVGGADPDALALAARLESADPRTQRAALVALGDLGTRAVCALPGILRRVAHGHASVRLLAIATLARLGALADAALGAAFDTLDPEGDTDEHLALVAAIAARGPQSAALPILARALGRDGTVLHEAEQHLRALGAAAVPAILTGGAELQDELREVALAILHDAGAGPALLAAARDRTRPAAERCLALAGLVVPDPELLPPLIELLNDPEEAICVGAAQRLYASHGADRAAAAPALARLLRRGNEHSRHEAWMVLVCLQQAALPELYPLLNDAVAEVRVAAGTAILRIEPVATAAALARQWLTSDQATSRRCVAYIVARLIRTDPAYGAWCRDLLADPAAEVRDEMLRWLPWIDWPPGYDGSPLWRYALEEFPDRRADLLRELNNNARIPLALRDPLNGDIVRYARFDPAPTVRRAALHILVSDACTRPDHTRGVIGDALLALLSDPDPEAFAEALSLNCLLQKEGEPPKFVGILSARVVNDPTSAGDAAASWLHPRTNPAGAPLPEYLAAMLHRLRTYQLHDEFNACIALDWLDYTPTADDVPFLVGHLNRERERNTRCAIGNLLERAGPGCVPALVGLLGSASPPEVQHQVLRLLYRFGPAAQAARAALPALLVSADESVRDAAANLLLKLVPAAEAAAVLLPFVEDPDWLHSYQLTALAEAIGAAALPWLPALLRSVRTGEPTSASNTHDVLIALAEQSDDVLTGLAELLGDTDASTRANAVAALTALAEAHDRYREQIADLLHRAGVE